MKTTALFVELLVIGTGTLLCIVCLVGIFFDVDPETVLRFKAWLPIMPFLLSLTYLLGIVCDRMADEVFNILKEKAIFEEVFGDDEQAYFHARRIIFTESEELTAQLEYGRSRLRVCRGWCLNSFFLTVLIPVFLYIKTQISWQMVLCTGVALGLLALACYVAWLTLTKTDYKKVKRQGEWLEERLATKAETGEIS